jgi:4-amino-4-deoxy-L-arabinose transferase-like glycosyltransferase
VITPAGVASSEAMSPGRTGWLGALLLSVIVLLDAGSMRHLSVTYDEPAHFRYGEQILSGDATRFDDSKMPFSALNALSSALAPSRPGGAPAATDARLEAGRYATVLFSLLVALCVWRWATDLYGPRAGLLALALYAFDPNLLAHSQLVTTDVFALGMTAWGLYTFWRFLRQPTLAWALASGGVLGLAQLAKYTEIFLLPVYALVALGFHAGDIAREWSRRDLAALRRRLARAAGFTMLFVVLGVAIINAGFLFDRTFTPIAGYAFRSELFTAVQQSLGPLGAIPVPLPYPYLEGLDWIVQRERSGEGYGAIYLLGELRRGQGFTGYFLYAALFKVPIVTLLVWLGALGTWVARRGPAALRRDEWVLLCPILFFTIYFNVFYRAQIGLRHYLVVFPLLHVLSGRLLLLRSPVDALPLGPRAASRGRWPRPARIAIGLAGAYLVASVLSYYPHYLAYFNELVPDRRLAYRILADSNLDWRQHRWYQARYLESHPDAIIEPNGPTVGTIIVGANSLTGVAGEPEKFRWLREHFVPAETIAYSTLVYHVTAADLDRLGLRSAPAAGP